MSWREEYAQLLSFLDACSVTYPLRIFNNIPEKDSTPVRRIAFALENMIVQLEKPLVPSTQALAQSLVYKFNGPHRRQGYWMNFKNLSRSLRKYNEDDLLKRVSDIHKKATVSSAGFYMPSDEVIRYIGSSYLKRLFRLQQIRDLCIRTSHVIMGQLELGHWEKFSLFIVAMCADISHGISKQVSGMNAVYEKIAGLLTSLDSRFPSSLSELSVFSDLSEKISAHKTVDTARVMRLLQMDDEQLEAARSKEQMAMFRDEVLSRIDLKNDSIDLGTTIERAVVEDKVYTDVPVTEFKSFKSASTSDSGLEVDFEAPSVASVSPTRESASSNVKKKKRLRKRKINERHMVDHPSLECSSSTVFENSEEDVAKDSDDIRTMSAKRKKRQGVEVLDTELGSQPVHLPSVSSSSVPVKRKKKKLKKSSLSQTIISTDFDYTESTSPAGDINFGFATFEDEVPKIQPNGKNHGRGAEARKRKSVDVKEKSFSKVLLSKKKKKRLTVD